MAGNGTPARRHVNGRCLRLGPVALALTLVGAAVPVVANAASLGVTAHRLTTYSAPADPPGCAGPGSQTLDTPSADSWIDESDPTKNNGTDSNLYVQSKTPSLNQRTLVRFALPSLRPGARSRRPSCGSTPRAPRARARSRPTGPHPAGASPP
jgi:hypothetical protein